MLNHQQFEDSEREKTEIRVSKYQQLYIYNNKEGESLDKLENKGEGENIGYIPVLFITPPQKESNCLTNIGKCGSTYPGHLA